MRDLGKIWAIFERSKKYQTLRMGTNYISFLNFNTS